MPAITRALTCSVRFDGRPPPELGGRAALAMLGLPLQPHPHLRSRRSMRGAGRGGPGERARDLAAFDRARRGAHRDGRPVGHHAWGLPAWRGRVGIRAAAGAVCGRIQRPVTGSGEPTTRACSLHCPSLGHRRHGHGLAPAPPLGLLETDSRAARHRTSRSRPSSRRRLVGHFAFRWPTAHKLPPSPSPSRALGTVACGNP